MAEKIREFRRILAANRGEIAIRVFRASTELGIRTVGIYSREDRLSLHRYKADEAYPVGEGKSPVAAYLGVEEIIDLARAKGVDAIHPGYGFLSENAEFASACEAAGIAFIGPPPEILRRAGNKLACRAIARQVGLPVIPGTPEPISQISEARAFVKDHGYPVMVKASFGGGGRGIRSVGSDAQLEEAIETARREAQLAFGNPEIFIEKTIESAKHIEVQVLADNHGNVIHLFERDCSVQRRFQKVIEYAPSLTLTSAQRQDLCEMAVRLASHLDYVNAGTVEFLMDRRGRLFFIEINPRIQVEHTVTEVVTGVDIVQSQIKIAQGYSLDSPEMMLPQEGVRLNGFAIQCRITTENPLHKFAPDYGRITAYRSASGFGIRLDAGSAFGGAVVTPFYDSLLVKVTAWGRSFAGAANRMRRTLAEFRVRGLATNIPFLDNVLRHPTFLEGKSDTSFIDSHTELFRLPERRDRATHLCTLLGDISLHGNPAVAPARLPPRGPVEAQLPHQRAGEPVKPGSRQILQERGADGLLKWIRGQDRLLVTDTTFRDAHQSLLATRFRTVDLLRIAPVYARRLPELFSIEMWGGATFDTMMRFLREDPWERVSRLREEIPNILFQMLLRGANAVGYTNYPANVVREFIRESAAAGIDIFRIFDSLNYIPNMWVAIDEVLASGKIAEGAICYTGDVLDPSRDRYTLEYYVGLARDLEKLGVQILGIKDMAGLCKPFAAGRLVKALKEEIGIPIHFHTHDTSGIQGGSILAACEAAVDIADMAIASMSGCTSQVNLNSIAASLKGHRRDPGLDLHALNDISDYFEDVRKWYYPFESELRAGTAEVYEHEMPGGQYSNLQQQASSLGLSHRWKEVKERYIAANLLLGDIVKVTPSSKIVGDLALFMVSNDLTRENIFERGKELSFPDSVVGFFSGNIGKPPFGFPRKFQDLVLRHRRGRKSASEKPKAVNFQTAARTLKGKIGREPTRRELLSYLLYPTVFLEFDADRKRYQGVASLLPTRNYFYGLEAGEEIAFDIEPGKTIILKLVNISEPGPEGCRKVVIEVNGVPREISILDRTAAPDQPRRRKADPGDLHQVGATIPGMVAELKVKPGTQVQSGEVILVLEAMKMQMNVCSNISGTVKDVYVSRGDPVESGDLLLTFE